MPFCVPGSTNANDRPDPATSSAEQPGLRRGEAEATVPEDPDDPDQGSGEQPEQPEQDPAAVESEVPARKADQVRHQVALDQMDRGHQVHVRERVEAKQARVAPVLEEPDRAGDAQSQARRGPHRGWYPT